MSPSRFIRFTLLSALLSGPGLRSAAYGQGEEPPNPFEASDEEMPEEVLPDEPAEPYRRPDLTRPLLDLKDTGLDEAARESVAAGLSLLVRNFPQDRRVTNRLRARALAVALRLVPDHRECIVANGQLARGMTPRVLSTPAPTDPETIAANLHEHALRLAQTGRPGPQQTGRLLLAIAAAVDWQYAEELVAALPPGTDLWMENAAGPPRSAGPPAPSIRLDQAAIRLVEQNPKGKPAAGRMEARLAAAGENDLFKMRVSGPGASAMGPFLELLPPLLIPDPAKHPQGSLAEVSMPAEGTPPAITALATGVLMERFLAGKGCHEAAILGCGLNDQAGIVSVYPLADIIPVCAAGAGAGPSLIIAASDEQALIDWLVRDRARWQTLFRIRFITAATLNDVTAVAAADRNPGLSRAFQRFDGIVFSVSDPAQLRRPEIMEALAETVQLYPRHLSASLLLRLAQGKLPRTLSLDASVARLDEAVARMAKAKLQAPVSGLERTEYSRVREELNTERTLLDERVQRWLREVMELARLLDRFATRPPPDQHGRTALQAEIFEQSALVRKARAAAAPQSTPPPPPRR